MSVCGSNKLQKFYRVVTVKILPGIDFLVVILRQKHVTFPLKIILISFGGGGWGEEGEERE
jgi:hypothetical protein